MNNPSLLIEFLARENARISFGDCWMFVEADTAGDIYFTVLQRLPYAKRNKQLYEGHNLADALWCLEHQEEYK